jgi:squalene-hopene/tetraprenyl-beta-curcumene cyclase
MSVLSFFPQHVQREIKEATTALDCLQKYWPDGFIPINDEETDDNTKTIYEGHPYLFAGAFPSLEPSDVQTLTLAGRLFAHSLFVYDGLMYRLSLGHSIATSALQAQAMQFEAYHLLHQLFAPSAVFWQRFRSYVAEYATVCLEEQSFTSGKRSWQEYTESLALEIAVGKAGIARTTIAGLVELARDDGAFEPLTASINHYYIARQMWDDLCDWKEDLRAGIPSLLLSRVLHEQPAQDDRGTVTNRVAREVYYGGHAQYVLQLALESLGRADGLTLEMPDLPWRRAIAELRRLCESLLHDIERIVRKNLKRVHEQPKFTLTLSAAENQWQQLAWDALRFIVGQWQLGFGEARHIMSFPHEQGFRSTDEYQYGDVFQRALIADALCDANEPSHNQLEPIIDYEVEYLTSARLSDVGGWSYFPELPELPPDADDLAQIIQVLLRSKRETAVADYCEAPLSALLHHNIHPDGSFETWILPPEGERTDEQRRQAEFVQGAWGTGPDNDVMANLLYALHLYDRGRFAGTIQRGVAYLEAHQQADGSWLSTWYHGPYYGTYVCLRLLTAAKPDSPAIRRALDFLRSRQRTDGGWGIDDRSDPLSTALSLLGLAIGQKCNHDPRDPDRAARALAYIQHSQEPDEAWPSCQFIRMEVGRATGRVQYVLSYGSRTVTTAFVMKAAIAWHGLADETCRGKRPGC